MPEGGEFFEVAGRSLRSAQDALTGRAADVPSTMAISQADLEVRAALEPGERGLSIRPLGLADLRAGGIAPELVSTVRVSYLPVSVDAPAPRREPGDVIDEIRRRPDVKRLGEILGELSFDAEYVAAMRRWIVSARDPQSRVVREVVLPDDA